MIERVRQKFWQAIAWLMLRMPRRAKVDATFEKAYRAKYWPVFLFNLGWSIFVGSAGILLFNRLGWWSCFYFFISGWNFAWAFNVVTTPFRIKDFTEEQEAHLQCQMKALFIRTVEEAKESGIIPEGVEFDYRKMN